MASSKKSRKYERTIFLCCGLIIKRVFLTHYIKAKLSMWYKRKVKVFWMRRWHGLKFINIMT